MTSQLDPKVRRPVTINLGAAHQLLSDLTPRLASLDGLPIAMGNTPDRAEAKRVLHYVADQLERTAAEVRMVHHLLNGFEDPLA